jgi:hypothetical protein
MEHTNPTMPPPPPSPHQNPYQQAPGGYQQQYGGFGGQIDHPKASSVQTLGIMGLIFTFLFGIVGLILNIIALSSGGSAMNEINSNPGRYTDASRSKIKAGRTCAIIGLSIQGFAIIVVLLALAASA